MGGQNPSVLTLILATADAPLLTGSRTPPTGPCMWPGAETRQPSERKQQGQFGGSALCPGLSLCLEVGGGVLSVLSTPQLLAKHLPTLPSSSQEGPVASVE